MPYPNLTTKIVKSTKRRGRGTGTGKGGTSGRGHKGQKARAGSKFRAFFEGGSIELYRRLPKKGGFKRHWVEKPAVVNIGDLAKFEISEIVNLKNLKAKNLIPNTAKSFKILSQGELKTALTIATELYSKAAKQKLDTANCQFVSEKPEEKPEKTTKSKKNIQ